MITTRNGNEDEIELEEAELIEQETATDTYELPPLTHESKVIWKLLRDFPTALSARLVSVLLFYVTFQLTVRENKESLAKGAALALLINISSVFREDTRMVTNVAKTELENQRLTGANDKIREVYLAAELSTLAPALGTTLTSQAIILIAEKLMANSANQYIFDEIRYIPSIFSFNHFFLNLLTVSTNISYARLELKSLVLIYGLGAFSIFGSYFGWRELFGTITTFMMANATQNFILFSSLKLKDYIYHSNERLFTVYFDKNKWRPAFKKALYINKASLQFSAITATELISDALWPILILNSDDAKSATALKFIPNTFNFVRTFEQTLNVRIIEATRIFQNNPTRLRKELLNILLHSTWIATSTPVFFSIIVLSFNRYAVSLLIKPTEENAAIIEKAERDLIWACLMVIFRSASSPAFAMVSAFRNNEVKFNRYATSANCLAPLITLGLGLLGDYLLGLGATGYWIGGSASVFLAMVFQFSNAFNVINNQTTNNPVSSSSWCSLWRRSSHHPSSSLPPPQPLQQTQTSAPNFFRRAYNTVSQIKNTTRNYFRI